MKDNNFKNTEVVGGIIPIKVTTTQNAFVGRHHER